MGNYWDQRRMLNLKTYYKEDILETEKMWFTFELIFGMSLGMLSFLIIDKLCKLGPIKPKKKRSINVVVNVPSSTAKRRYQHKDFIEEDEDEYEGEDEYDEEDYEEEESSLLSDSLKEEEYESSSEIGDESERKNISHSIRDRSVPSGEFFKMTAESLIKSMEDGTMGETVKKFVPPELIGQFMNIDLSNTSELANTFQEMFAKPSTEEWTKDSEVIMNTLQKYQEEEKEKNNE